VNVLFVGGLECWRQRSLRYAQDYKRSYFNDLIELHDNLGLSVRLGGAVAMASLVGYNTLLFTSSVSESVKQRSDVCMSVCLSVCPIFLTILQLIQQRYCTVMSSLLRCIGYILSYRRWRAPRLQTSPSCGCPDAASGRFCPSV